MSDDRQPRGITAITVSGFKSLCNETTVEIRPLTLLAGANSSGKSSIMQPLLLMKQTLEAPYDPGTFLLDGPNVTFTDLDQFLTSQQPLKVGEIEEGEPIIGFLVNVRLQNQEIFEIVYPKLAESLLIPFGIEYWYKNINTTLSINLKHNEIIQRLGSDVEQLRSSLQEFGGFSNAQWRVKRSRCFLNIGLYSDAGETYLEFGDVSLKMFPLGNLRHAIQELVHVPRIRSSPKREYPIAADDSASFEGTFDNYVASLIELWQRTEDENIIQLNKSLQLLGLTSHIQAKPLNDAQIELQVGRTLQSDGTDMVSLADVGFGVSQVMPVLVALLAAQPGQLVYLEQPELHLHPRAQVALASVLADAANRGVRVVAETHSSLLLLGVQTLIAQGKLSPDKVMLHWFTRGEDGVTTVNSVEPDENGAYGDWPEDFGAVELDASSAYLDAVELRELEQLGDSQKS